MHSNKYKKTYLLYFHDVLLNDEVLSVIESNIFCLIINNMRNYNIKLDLKKRTVIY